MADKLSEIGPHSFAYNLRASLPYTLRDKFKIKVASDPFHLRVSVTFTHIVTDQVYVTVLDETGCITPEFEALLCVVA